MISYIQKKKIDEQKISNLLKLSSEANQFTNDGPVKKRLENLLHEKFSLSKNKSVICLSNGTTACHSLMFLYEKIKKRKLRWCVPSFTFPTPVVSGFNAKIFDISNETFTIPIPSSSSILDEYDGIIITNLFGTVSQIKEWQNYCEKNNKILIFDNASSPLTRLEDTNICDYGNSSFGSLHHTKYLGFGEGGFVVVPNEYYTEINSIANFGFTSERIHSKLSSNFKISEVSSAYCYAHAENYDINRHVEIQEFLIKEFKKFNLKVFNVNNSQDVNYVLGNMPLLFDNRIEVSSFRNLGIEANKYYRPLRPFRNSKNLFERIINLPLNSSLSDYEIDLICKICHDVKKVTDGK